MLKNRFRIWPLGLIAFIASFIWCASTSAGEFSADFDQRLHGKDLSGKIRVKGQKYRVEIDDDPKALPWIIVDQKANRTVIADPVSKEYEETPSQDMLSLMSDPFQSARYMEGKYQRVALGMETISGYECQKMKFETQGKEMMTAWRSEALGFFLKISLPDQKNTFIKLKHIKEGPQEAALFQIPSGFAQKEDPVKKREREEAALGVLTTTYKSSAPLARRIGKGGKIQVNVDPAKSVRVTINNLVKGESTYTITAFRNNQPIKMDIEATYSLTLKGRRKSHLLGMQNRADQIAVKVNQGKILADVKIEESSFAKDKIKTFFMLTGTRDSQRQISLDTKRLVRLQVSGESQDAAEAKVQVIFHKASVKDKIDEAEVVLKNGESKEWQYPVNKGVQNIFLKVAKGGGIKVRIEQPASKKRAASQRSKTSHGKPSRRKISKYEANLINKAFISGNVQSVEAVLDNGMPIESKLYGRTLLMQACNVGTAGMVKMLIDRGADLKHKNKQGDDALAVAMSNSRHWKEVVPLLIEAGAPIGEETPIWRLAYKTKKGKLEPEAKKLLKRLFANGASPDCYTGKQKTTVIMYYAKKGWFDPLRFFIDQGANVNAQSTGGQTALSEAQAKPRRPGNAKRQKERQAVIELLKSKGAK